MNTLIKLVLAPIATYIAIVATAGCSATVANGAASLTQLDLPASTIVVPATEAPSKTSQGVAEVPDCIDRVPSPELVDTAEPESAIALNASDR